MKDDIFDMDMMYKELTEGLDKLLSDVDFPGIRREYEIEEMMRILDENDPADFVEEENNNYWCNDSLIFSNKKELLTDITPSTEKPNISQDRLDITNLFLDLLEDDDKKFWADQEKQNEQYWAVQEKRMQKNDEKYTANLKKQQGRPETNEKREPSLDDMIEEGLDKENEALNYDDPFLKNSGDNDFRCYSPLIQALLQDPRENRVEPQKNTLKSEPITRKKSKPLVKSDQKPVRKKRKITLVKRENKIESRKNTLKSECKTSKKRKPFATLALQPPRKKRKITQRKTIEEKTSIRRQQNTGLNHPLQTPPRPVQSTTPVFLYRPLNNLNVFPGQQRLYPQRPPQFIQIQTYQQRPTQQLQIHQYQAQMMFTLQLQAQRNQQTNNTAPRGRGAQYPFLMRTPQVRPRTSINNPTTMPTPRPGS